MCRVLLSLFVAGMGVTAEQVDLRGRLVDANTRQPIANAIISATSKTRQLHRAEATTADDGSFVLHVEPGLPYAVCSRSAGRYISTCTFSKPVTVIADGEAKPLLLTAPPGIRLRVRIQDPSKRIPLSRVPVLATDPLDLLVYAEESNTRTRIPFPVTSEDANGFEIAAVIPATPSWRLAMSSMHHAFDDVGGRRYLPDSAIVPAGVETGGEHTVVFSVLASK